MNRNLSLRFENLGIFLAWIVLFMFVLTGDQEKIVALNLLLFCYFIYYLASLTIFNSLNSRKRYLLDNLLSDVSFQIVILKSLYTNIVSATAVFSKIINVVLKKTLVYVYNLVLPVACTNSLMFGHYFYNIQTNLNVVANQANSKSLQYNLFVSSILVREIKPSLGEDDVFEEAGN